MPQLVKPDLEQVITELLVELRPQCCRVVQCPPFPHILKTASALGQIIYIVPDSISPEEAVKQIEQGHLLATRNNYHIISDGRPGDVLHLSLSSHKKDWRLPVIAILNRLLGEQWEMVYAERVNNAGGSVDNSVDITHLGLLRADQEEMESGKKEKEKPAEENGQIQREVWLAPVQRRIVAGCTKKIKKKVIRKIIRKSSKDEAIPNGTTMTMNGGIEEARGKGGDDNKNSEKAIPQHQQCPIQMENGIGDGTAKGATQNGKNNNSTTKGGGVVGRIANLFNGMNNSQHDTNRNSPTARGRSQSLEEAATAGPIQNGTTGKREAATNEEKKLLKRADSEGGGEGGGGGGTKLIRGKEMGMAPMQNGQNGLEANVNCNGNGNGIQQSAIQQRESSSFNGFVRIPVQLNGATKMGIPEQKHEEQEEAASIINVGHSKQQPGHQPNGVASSATTNVAPSFPSAAGAVQCASSANSAISLPISSNRPSASASATSSTAVPMPSVHSPFPSFTNGATAEQPSPSLHSPPSNSPPPLSVGSSDSPNSFHSAISGAGGGGGEASAPLLALCPTRRWRREDGGGTTGTAAFRRNIGGAAGNATSATGMATTTTSAANRLGPSMGSLLSPISSCGSVEQQEVDGIEEKQEQSEVVDDDDFEEEEEDESTLMLLNRSERATTLGADDADELSCSFREDFSLGSASLISQKGPPPRSSHPLPMPTTTTTRMPMSATIQNRVGPFLTRVTPIGSSQSSNIHSRDAESPSPPKQATSMSPAAGGGGGGQMVRGMLGHFRMPVPVLQQILGLFPYKQLGELRRVHPHWDELCGQLLNAAHSQLLHRAQRLLTECQRRVHREPRMAQPIQLLTRLHVHVLNPVDGMRAFMDEGVLCFPYGALLDRAFGILHRVERMIANAEMDSNETREREYDQIDLQMDQTAEMARRAALHYRQWVEPEAEKRMSELYRASAQQRLQRIDSFLVESSVSRVEREAEKSRTELGWEMEQLRQQNQQLRKENRELRQLCQRLDQRVDVLERKFKTMARLLQ